jgi:hypothetical protein
VAGEILNAYFELKKQRDSLALGSLPTNESKLKDATEATRAPKKSPSSDERAHVPSTGRGSTYE